MQVQQQRVMKKVLVAIDDSEGSFLALRWALDNLCGVMGIAAEANEEGGMLTLLHVQEPFQHYLFPAGPGPSTVYATPSAVECVRKAQEENAAALLAKAMHMCKDKNVKAETLIVEGNPKEKICELAEELHMDLLLVGSRGLSKIKRAFLGSVSDYCAHHAVCPVVIVKPSKEHHK